MQVCRGTAHAAEPFAAPGGEMRLVAEGKRLLLTWLNLSPLLGGKEVSSYVPEQAKRLVAQEAKRLLPTRLNLSPLLRGQRG